MSRYILALDQGTTSSRAIVFDHNGHPCSISQKQITQYFPSPGLVEQDPEEIWRTQIESAHQAIRMANISVGDIAAIGIANQRETTVLWDRETGRPVHKAIVWQDRRTAARCAELIDKGLAGRIAECTGLVPDSYFSATKLEWLLDNVPGARAKAEAGRLAFGTIDSFLLWRLTKGRVHATDITNASRTMLYNIDSLDWSQSLLDEFRVPREILPDVGVSSSVFGLADREIFGAELPIAGIAGDQQAAMFGQACFRPGMAKSTYGTGCFLLMHTGCEAKPSYNKLLTTLAACSGKVPEYALEGSVFVAGAAVQWLRDELGIIRHASEIEQLAMSVPDSAGVTVVPAFTGLGAPYWDSSARGAILGLTRGAGKAHIARATLESIAFQCLDVLEAMSADNGFPLSEVRVDGGAASNDFLMQFQTDILGIPLVRPTCTETTALGAAYLAGVAVGIWSSKWDIEALWSKGREFQPSISASRRDKLVADWKEAVNRVRT